MPYKNPDKQREFQRTYYGDRRKNYNRNRRIKLKNFVDSVALKFGCKECGYRRCVSALHFHHTKNNKYESVSRMVSNKRSIDDIKKEMRKCIILCANCHAEVHQNNRR